MELESDRIVFAKINRFIRKLAVIKQGYRVILPAASTYPRLKLN